MSNQNKTECPCTKSTCGCETTNQCPCGEQCDCAGAGACRCGAGCKCDEAK